MPKLKPLTTGQAAGYCNVSQATIINWIKKGSLKAYTTPGGHHRIPLPDFVAFLERYSIPVDPILERSLKSQDDGGA
jgi:excisionase family DNA binding protein